MRDVCFFELQLLSRAEPSALIVESRLLPNSNITSFKLDFSFFFVFLRFTAKLVWKSRVEFELYVEWDFLGTRTSAGVWRAAAPKP